MVYSEPYRQHLAWRLLELKKIFGRCFNVDTERGLTPIRDTLRLFGANETTPPIGPFGTFSVVVFNDAGTELLALKKGFSDEEHGKYFKFLEVGSIVMRIREKGFLAVWNVLPAGVLTPTAQVLTVPGPGYGPFSLTSTPGRPFLGSRRILPIRDTACLPLIATLCTAALTCLDIQIDA